MTNVGSPRENLWNRNYSSTGTIQTAAFVPHPSSWPVVWARSSQAGTLYVDYVDTQGTVSALYNTAVVATVLTAIRFNMCVPKFQVRFVPAAAPGAETLVIDVSYDNYAGQGA